MSIALRPYPEYKDSGVPWLGQVPAHWQQLPGRACFIEKKAPNIGMQETTVLSLSYGQIVVKPPEKLHGLVPASFETYQIIEPHDIVIRPTDLQNDWVSLRTGLARTRGIITSAYMRLRTKVPLVPEYGHLLLHAYDLKKVFYGLGSGLRQNLSWRDFKYLPCLVPPPDEQAAIARFLDHHDRLTRRYIRAQRRLIELLTEQKQALIQQAVTRGLDPDVPLKDSGIEWLGEVPERWDTEPLFVFLKERSVPNAGNTVKKVLSLSYGRIVERNIERFEGLFPASFGTYQIVEPGNIILRLTDLQNDQKSLRVGLVRDLGIITSAYLCLQVSDRMVSEYIYYLLHSYDVQKVFYGMGGGCRQSIGYRELKRLPILVPPTNEQLAICEWVESQVSPMDVLIDRAQRQIDVVREHRTRLIADVVTGKLDVRGVSLPDLDEASDLSNPDGLEEGAELDGLDVEEMDDADD